MVLKIRLKVAAVTVKLDAAVIELVKMDAFSVLNSTEGAPIPLYLNFSPGAISPS